MTKFSPKRENPKVRSGPFALSLGVFRPRSSGSNPNPSQLPNRRGAPSSRASRSPFRGSNAFPARELLLKSTWKPILDVFLFFFSVHTAWATKKYGTIYGYLRLVVDDVLKKYGLHTAKYGHRPAKNDHTGKMIQIRVPSKKKRPYGFPGGFWGLRPKSPKPAIGIGPWGDWDGRILFL